LLDLGNGDALAVSTGVADALSMVSIPDSATSSSNTASVTSGGLIGAGNGTAGNQSNASGGEQGLLSNQTNPTPGLPNIGAGLVVFPGTTPTGNASIESDVAAISNPEPASLIFLGTGLIFGAAYMRRRHRSFSVAAITSGSVIPLDSSIEFTLEW
jgi:hypothetical protein